MSDKEKLVAFMCKNKEDLQTLGLLFCRLLQSDIYSMEAKPSATFVAVMKLSESGKLGTIKTVERLIIELDATGEELLTDGCGGSILRL